ncbi:MAG TPA: DNA/RNA non-specific endonuclease [Actinomycetes bacterium]|nr:DNA/RNA non-specific endonuclease [Actinomycetes bacterium]
MPRRRRTRTRSRSRTRRGPRRRSSGLTGLLVAVLVVGALWVLAGGDLPGRGPGPGPGPRDRDRPDRTEDARANQARIRQLGGAVDYGHVNARTGQRSGVTATITPRMVQAAADHQLGSEADADIRPPGFDQLPARNRARGHLLGRQLGGSGEVAGNLVAMYQSRANSPVMRDFETEVADTVEHGQTVRYEVRPVYPSPDWRGAPRAVRLRASGDRGFRLDVEIANTPQAQVKELAGAPG